jgi:hypothetical protein
MSLALSGRAVEVSSRRRRGSSPGAGAKTLPISGHDGEQHVGPRKRRMKRKILSVSGSPGAVCEPPQIVWLIYDNRPVGASQRTSGGALLNCRPRSPFRALRRLSGGPFGKRRGTGLFGVQSLDLTPVRISDGRTTAVTCVGRVWGRKTGRPSTPWCRRARHGTPSVPVRGRAGCSSSRRCPRRPRCSPAGKRRHRRPGRP